MTVDPNADECAEQLALGGYPPLPLVDGEDGGGGNGAPPVALASPDDDDEDDDGEHTHDVPHARGGDPWTSQASGAATEREEGSTSLIRPKTNKHLALKTIVNNPCTALEAERLTGKRGLWKRVSDLKPPGLIEEVGERRDPLTQRTGLVWAVTEKGRSVLEKLEAGESVRV